MNLIEILLKRRSIRVFSEKEITESDMNQLFEVATQAPSAYNEQPWIYYYAMKKNTVAFNKFLNCLGEFNQNWAKNAQVLILSIGVKNYEQREGANRFFVHDVGSSNAFLALKATELGFQAHQMGGFDRQKAIDAFNLDSQKYEPVTMIALGFEPDYSKLAEDVKNAELAVRPRKKIENFIKKFE
jgi:nitroreductase